MDVGRDKKFPGLFRDCMKQIPRRLEG